MTTPGWALEVTRDDLGRTSLVEADVPTGPEGLRDAWREVLGGGSDPGTGHVVQL